jgi:hypothetical protein
MPRLYVAVLGRDGSAEIVNAGRPGSLVAFSDAHDGKVVPESTREIAWLVHHAFGITEPLDRWLDTLEDVSVQPEDLELVRKVQAGELDLRAYLDAEIKGDQAAPDPTQPTANANGTDPLETTPATATPGEG